MTTSRDPYSPPRDPYLAGANILLAGGVVAGLAWVAIQFPMAAAMVVGSLLFAALVPYAIGKAWYAAVDRLTDDSALDDDQRERASSPSLADLPEPHELDRTEAATRALTESSLSGLDTSTGTPPSPYLDGDAWTPPHERDDGEVNDDE